MFEQRLRWVLVVFVIGALIVTVRLIDLQVVHANTFRQQAADALLVSPQELPFIRGRILDRTGRVLVADEPTWDLKLDYGVIAAAAGDTGYKSALVTRHRRDGRYGEGLNDAQVETALDEEFNRMWQDVGAAFAQPPQTLHLRAHDTREHIRRIRRTVAANRGFDAPVAEERLPHAIVTGLDDQVQVSARERFAKYPWLHVEPANRRKTYDCTSLAHIIGRTGNVSAKDVAEDPFRDDPLQRYQGDERLGIMGVEKAAEMPLRGRRGMLQKNRAGNVVERIEPVDGEDVTLTISYDLQHRLYDLLGSETAKWPHANGGSIIVLDVASRDVLAMVSYPSYDPERFSEDYRRLRNDTLRMPLRFRAVSNRYAPGSIIKPLTCLAGLSSGRIGLDTTINCEGYLFPDNPNAGGSKCWQVSGTTQRMRHGPINVVQAIEGSCNIFMYRVGLDLGVDPLCSFFEMFGIGEYTGIDLDEETRGINPNSTWLDANLGERVNDGRARQYAIGQGEVALTPIQAANLMATYADSQFKYVRLIEPSPNTAASQEKTDSLSWQLPVSESHWRAIREGLFGVVNSPDGTAHKYVHFSHPRYALAGKTGSATVNPQPVSYRIPYVGADDLECITVLHAGSRREAIDDFSRMHPDATFDPDAVTLHEKWPNHPPADGGNHAHAWFAGYFQEIDEARRPLLDRKPEIAFVILIEYGGSGGKAAGAAAGSVAEAILETLGDSLDANTLGGVG